jgi:hypothetical protein
LEFIESGSSRPDHRTSPPLRSWQKKPSPAGAEGGADWENASSLAATEARDSAGAASSVMSAGRQLVPPSLALHPKYR